MKHTPRQIPNWENLKLQFPRWPFWCVVMRSGTKWKEENNSAALPSRLVTAQKWEYMSSFSLLGVSIFNVHHGRPSVPHQVFPCSPPCHPLTPTTPFHNPNTAPIFPPSLISQTGVGKQENPKSQLNIQRNTRPNTCTKSRSLPDSDVGMFLYNIYDHFLVDGCLNRGCITQLIADDKIGSVLRWKRKRNKWNHCIFALDDKTFESTHGRQC